MSGFVAPSLVSMFKSVHITLPDYVPDTELKFRRRPGFDFCCSSEDDTYKYPTLFVTLFPLITHPWYGVPFHHHSPNNDMVGILVSRSTQIFLIKERTSSVSRVSERVGFMSPRRGKRSHTVNFGMKMSECECKVRIIIIIIKCLGRLRRRRFQNHLDHKSL